MSNMLKVSRRRFLGSTMSVAAACGFAPTRFAIGQTAKVKVGLLLPYTGTYASLGHNITDAMTLAFGAAGSKLGGRDIELVKVDSEADPAKAPATPNKLVIGGKGA